MEELKVTSISDYTAARTLRKLVTLPSGSVFEIKKITGRDYLREGGLGLQSIAGFANPKVSAEKNQVIFDKMSADEKQKSLEITEALIVRSVSNPAISLVPEPEKLCVKDIDDEDFYFLLKEVTEFSFGKKDLEFFRKEPESVNS